MPSMACVIPVMKVYNIFGHNFVDWTVNLFNLWLTARNKTATTKNYVILKSKNFSKGNRL